MEFKKKYEAIIGNNKFIDKKFTTVLRKSKLVICTYPETTFVESIVSNIPTILLCLKNIWEFDNNFKKVISLLYKNKIIFFDPNEAAKHVEKINHNPYLWWHNKNTRYAKKIFLKECANISKDWMTEWKKYILKNGTN